MITNLIELCMGKLILKHLIGNNCSEFRNELVKCYFFKITLGSEVIIILQKKNSCFQTRALNAICHMLCLNPTLKLSFEFRMSYFLLVSYVHH